jgi:ribosome-associated protein
MTLSGAIRVNTNISIPRGELRFSFVRSSGPGGQNVNKVASKAVLRWNVFASEALGEDARRRLISRERRRMNDRGELIIASQRFRDQRKNIDDCLEKLIGLVKIAAVRPRVRKKTKSTLASREARLHNKRAVSEKKRRRQLPGLD